MTDRVAIPRPGRPPFIFRATCNNEKCGVGMSHTGGAGAKFTMLCARCGSRLFVFVADDPENPLMVWKSECPQGTNFYDYLRTLPRFLAWKQFHDGRPRSAVATIERQFPVAAAPG